jgi:hypothetical protein
MVCLSGVFVRAQKQSPTIDCSVDGRHLTCDRGEFLRRFAEAKTVALESQPRDHVADAQLAGFAKRLGKQVDQGSPADLTIRVVRPAETGFGVGPMDVELASLRVFASKDGPDKSRLLWVETYKGQPDVPWQAVVRAITSQLQNTIAGR